jgi:hypothetical protein
MAGSPSTTRAPARVQFHLTLAHQFERRGEARRKHRRLLRGIDDVAQQVVVEAAPVFGLGHADQPLQRRTRFGERPHRALGQMHGCQHALLTLRGISREQVEQRGREFRMPDFGDRFRIAARKDIALKLRPVHQPVGGFTDRLEPAQPVGQGGGHFFRARPVRRRRLGQQQA